MAILAADSTADLRHRGAITWFRRPVSGVADTYYKGAVCSYLAAGKITPVSAASLPMAGFATTTPSGAVTTSDRVEVFGGEVLIPWGSAAQTDEGTLIYIDVSEASDNPADLDAAAATPGTNDVAIGMCVEFVSSTLGGWADMYRTTLPTIAS